MIYVKDFDSWIKVKKDIEVSDKKEFYFKEREKWWTSIGVNLGREVDGKNRLFERPILIFKKVNRDQFLGLPITSVKKGYLYKDVRFNFKTSSVNLSQVKCFSSKRLVRKIATLNSEDYREILGSTAEFLFRE